MRYDAILIGAGMSGLGAALRLALFGKRVVVLERHELWGGLNSFYTKDGHAFDVGLHALTNWAPPRQRGAPLTKLLRQLRLRHQELKLGEQGHSELRVPGVKLRFSNDERELEAEIARDFPDQVDGFRALVRHVREAVVDERDGPGGSGRALLERHLTDPLLVDALMVPMCYYGSAREDDVDEAQLVTLFRAIFLEGLSRPEGGIRPFLNLLIKRLKAAGVELRLRAGVARVLVESGRTVGVELDDGTRLEAPHVLSSAGYVETMALAGLERERVRAADVGRLSFVETISVVDRPPSELGLTASTIFYSTATPFRYRRPEERTDVCSGVVSIPDHFAAERPPAESLVRVTVLANHERWSALDEPAYRAAKEADSAAALEEVCALVGDWRPCTTYTDVFTPCTIERFTGHRAGAVYGSPRKRMGGESGVPGLHLIGTDQGYLGVVGALLSGVTMANRHVLAEAVAGASTEEVPA